MLEILAALMVLAGLFGVILPVLPGTPLIFGGALLYDYANGWQMLGWGWLAVLGLLMVIALVSDLVLSQATARRGGASWRAIGVGFVLGLIGMVLLPPFGLIIGSIAGVLGTELLLRRATRHAVRASGGWLIGWVAGLILQGTIALVMVVILLWQTRGMPLMGS